MRRPTIQDQVRTFGVEIECLRPAGWTLEQVADKLKSKGIDAYVPLGGYSHRVSEAWKVVYDASIGGINSRSLEVVSPPLKGAEGEKQLRKVLFWLRKIGCQVNKKCSVHVHVGLAGASGSQAQARTLASVVALYRQCEAHIDTLHVPSRREDRSPWCGSLQKHRFTLSQARNIGRYTGSRFGEVRYRKINPIAWLKYGTCEFRQHGGTLEAWKLIPWINLCIGMVDRAERLKSARLSCRKDAIDIDKLFRACKLDAVSTSILKDRARALAHRHPATTREPLCWPNINLAPPANLRVEGDALTNAVGDPAYVWVVNGTSGRWQAVA